MGYDIFEKFPTSTNHSSARELGIKYLKSYILRKTEKLNIFLYIVFICNKIEFWHQYSCNTPIQKCAFSGKSLAI